MNIEYILTFIIIGIMIGVSGTHIIQQYIKTIKTIKKKHE